MALPGSFPRWFTRPASVQERNVRNVLIDGIGVGLVNGVATFLSVFMVRLGASPFLVGLLTSMPALTGIVLAIPVGRLLERQRNIVPWYSRARVWVLGSYALTGLVPFIRKGRKGRKEVRFCRIYKLSAPFALSAV